MGDAVTSVCRTVLSCPPASGQRRTAAGGSAPAPALHSPHRCRSGFFGGFGRAKCRTQSDPTGRPSGDRCAAHYNRREVCARRGYPSGARPNCMCHIFPLVKFDRVQSNFVLFCAVKSFLSLTTVFLSHDLKFTHEVACCNEHSRCALERSRRAG